MSIRKADLIEILGTHVAVAQVLGITRSAVSQWGEFIPELQEYRLRDRNPTLYRRVAARINPPSACDT